MPSQRWCENAISRCENAIFRCEGALYAWVSKFGQTPVRCKIIQEGPENRLYVTKTAPRTLTWTFRVRLGEWRENSDDIEQEILYLLTDQPQPQMAKQHPNTFPHRHQVLWVSTSTRSCSAFNCSWSYPVPTSRMQNITDASSVSLALRHYRLVFLAG